MQGSLFPDGYPFCVRQETDTATPRTPIPIYTIHTLEKAVCRNPLCICRRYEAAVRRLLGAIDEGMLTLAAAAPLLAAREETGGGTTATAEPTRTVIHVDLLADV